MNEEVGRSRPQRTCHIRRTLPNSTILWFNPFEKKRLNGFVLVVSNKLRTRVP
jgi:hypothetical protein